MARILVAHPYHLALDPREAALGKPYPPIFTMVVAAGLREAGHDVVFHDAMFEVDESGFGAVIDRAGLDAGRGDRVLIVAGDHSVQIKQCLARIRDTQMVMARAARDRGLAVLVSGPDVSDRPQVYLDAGASTAGVGDVTEAAVAWVAGERGIAGLHGEQGAGGRREVIADLDALPDPAWDLVDMAAYARVWRRRHGAWEVNVWTARGCPYTCNWCAKPVWGRTFHARSPDRVAREIAVLRERYAPDRIWFTDDIFALRRAWLADLRVALGAAPLPFRCLSRADLLEDPHYVDDLAACGCDEVWIGAESGSDRILSAMDKGSTVAEIERATVLLHAAGVRVGFFLQLGYPGEGLSDVRATIRMVRTIKPDEIGVSVSYPLPGTAFHDRVAASMKATNWESSMDNRTLFEAPFQEGFYGAAKEVLRSTHSAAQARERLRAFVRAPGRRTARKLAGALFHAARLPLAHGRMRIRARANPRAVRLDW